MIKAVLDTNVLISALLTPTGAPAELVRAWRDGRFELIVSPKVVEELRGVLRRPKFRKAVDEEEIEQYANHLVERGLLVDDPTEAIMPATSDPDDDFIVPLGVSAADVLVTGDRVLLHSALPIPVISPRAFLDALEATRA